MLDRTPPTPASAWFAVAAGTLGAFMATLDISIVNSALPTIQGEIGATGTEGTWVGTAYLVAEIIVIPLAGWFERLLGLRTLLLLAAVLFTVFSIACGTATTLLAMILGRVGQGFTGGVMIPTAQTIIARQLPPERQPIGLMLFGVTAILGPVVGPLVGGWITENVSWHYAFFLSVPLCLIMAVLLLIGLPHQRTRLHLIAEADWLGIIGLSLGLGALTVLLEEGQREQWFTSPLIRLMALLSLVGFTALGAGQLSARRPVIKLALLADRQFGSVALLALVLGIVLYGTAYAIPQFLAFAADYNALQSGEVVLVSGIPSLALMAAVPLMLRSLDLRLAVALAMVCMGASCLLDASLTSLSSGSDFTAPQLLRGIGQILGMLFLSQAVVRSVPLADAADASGLFNAFRNLGGSVGLAGISTLQDERFWFHARRIEETVNANSERAQDYARLMGSAERAAMHLDGIIQEQALVMTFNDIFWIMGVCSLIVLPLAFLLRPLPAGGAAVIH